MASIPDICGDLESSDLDDNTCYQLSAQSHTSDPIAPILAIYPYYGKRLFMKGFNLSLVVVVDEGLGRKR